MNPYYVKSPISKGKDYTVHKHLGSSGSINLDWNGNEVEKECCMSYKQACAVAKYWGGYVVEIY